MIYQLSVFIFFSKSIPNIYGLIKRKRTRGDLAKVKYLIKKGANVHAQGDNALILSSKNGHLEVVKYLIKKGANVHEQGDNSLILSSENNHLEVVKYLIEKGANVHAQYDMALALSSEYGHLEIVKYLIEKGAQYDMALVLSSEYGHLEIVKYLIESGANVHAQEDNALILSSENNHLEIVKYLIESGANVHAQEDNALILSSENNHLEIVKYLIEKGADVNARKGSALKTATQYGNLSLVKFLVENGSRYVQEAKIIARDKKYDDIIKFLSRPGELKKSVKKIISLYKDKKIFYKWQKICSSLNDKDLPELRNLANLHGVTETESKKKRDICKILSTKYQEQMLKPVECDNETTILGDPVALIPKPLLFTVKEGKFNYCFNILELMESLKAGDSRNPLTREELPVDEIQKAMLRLRHTLIESKLSFVNILEEIKNNDIMDKAGILKFSVVNLISKLRYPPSVEDIVKMNRKRVKQMFKLLKENPLTLVYGPETLENLIKESTRILSIDDTEKSTRLTAYEIYLNEVFN